MAQWIRSWSGSGGPTGTDADVVNALNAAALTNDTAPADFDPSAVNSVRFQLTLYVSSGTIVDDSYTGTTTTTEVYNASASPTVAAAVAKSWTPSAINSGASSMSFDVTDSSVNQTWTTAQWEGMAWITASGGSWATFTAGMKADGTTVSVQSATITIDYTPSGTNYNETGKAFTITSTTTGTDSANFADSKSFTVTSTVSSTDTSAMDELNLATTVTSTFTGTDGLFFDETGKAFTVTSTITGPNDALTLGETGKTFTITSTTTGTDTSAMVESQSFTITSTFTGTDTLHTGGTNYDETGKAFTVTSTVTLTDAHTNTESRSFTITSTTTGTDAFHTSDSGAFTITSTVTGPNDQYTMGETGLSFTVTSTTTGTDVAAFIQSLAFIINSVISGSEVYTPAGGVPAPPRDIRGRSTVRPTSDTRDRTG